MKMQTRAGRQFRILNITVREKTGVCSEEKKIQEIPQGTWDNNFVGCRIKPQEHDSEFHRVAGP